MAYPNNLAPATPSANYDVVAFANGIIRYALLKGGAYLTIQGAKSRCRIDMPFYNGGTTRDTIDASFCGRGQMVITMFEGALYTASQYSPLYNLNGDSILFADTPGTFTPTKIPDEVATMQQQADQFTHTPPHQDVLAMSYIRYYDAVAAGGNLIAEIPVPIFRGDSTQIPTTVGFAPPAFTPA